MQKGKKHAGTFTLLATFQSPLLEFCLNLERLTGLIEYVNVSWRTEGGGGGGSMEVFWETFGRMNIGSAFILWRCIWHDFQICNPLGLYSDRKNSVCE